ncbi:flagellar hook-length control protein FliK [Lysobacter olei]
MIGPGVSMPAAAPSATPATDAVPVRGAAPSGADESPATSSFERLMEPAASASAPAATPETHESAPEPAEATSPAADPAQLLALLSQSALAGAVASGDGGTTAASAVGTGVSTPVGAASPSTTVASLGGVGPGLVMGPTVTPTAAPGSPAVAAAPFGLADAAGAMALPPGLVTAAGVQTSAPGQARPASGPAPLTDPAALLGSGLPAAAPAAAQATATPATLADAASLALVAETIAPTDAPRGGDPLPDSPAWLGAALPTTGTASTASTAPVPPASLAMPADPAEGFDDGLTTQLTWMAAQGLGEARIRVTPDHLGTIDLVLNLDGQRISAEFQSAHADVRQALEGGLSRLRDQLAQHGLQLVQAQVGDGGDSRRSPRREDAPARDADAQRPGPAHAVTATAVSPARRARLLDTYA